MTEGEILTSVFNKGYGLTFNTLLQEGMARTNALQTLWAIRYKLATPVVFSHYFRKWIDKPRTTQ